MAKAFVAEIGFEMPALLDLVDDAVSKAYASHPDRLYLIGKDGKVAYAGDRGPMGFKPEQLQQAILVATGKAQPAKVDADKESGRDK